MVEERWFVLCCELAVGVDVGGIFDLFLRVRHADI
jgi:hypothetical protein